MILRVMLSVGLLSLSPGTAAADPEERTSEAPEYEMGTFQLVFLVEAHREEPILERRAGRMRTAQKLYQQQLVRDGVALISGPVTDGGRVKEVAILRFETTGEAEAAYARSPAVTMGAAEAEAFVLWAAKGILREPEDPAARTTCYLGLLKRPDDAPSYPTEELERIQKGHLANMGKMADSGDLVLAGPVENAADLRGILIFRTRDPERIEALVAEDPAVKAGRLKLELLEWDVAAGTFPDRHRPQE